MANYNLVIDSQFKPFSYQEMLAPTLMATQVHQELENQYGELAAKANVWEEMANEETDPYAYKMYKTYANDLEEQAGQLAREGLNAASRKDALNMRARYSKEITPIEQAYTARQKQAEEQQKALLQDPTLMLSRRAANTSLDDYIRNPQLAYDSYSGKLITAQVASAASALSKQMRENPRKWRRILDNSYYETLMQKGFKTEDVLKAIQGNPEASQELTKIVKDAVDSSGVKKWGNKDTIARAIGYANQGLWNAVGETQYQTLDNWKEKMRITQQQNNSQPTSKGFALNPSNIYNSRELSEDEKKYNDNINKFSKYFSKDAQGRTVLNKDGMEEYRKNAAPKALVRGPGGGTSLLKESETQIFIPSEFKEFMDSLGMNSEQGIVDNWNGIAIGNLWQKYVNDNPSAKTAKYDAIKTSEYIYDVDQSPEYQREYKSKVSRAIGSDEKLKEVEYNSKTNKWEIVGELKFSDFDTDDYSLVARAPSEIGTTIFIKKEGEKAKRYLPPSGINITAEEARDAVITDMLKTQRLLQNPKLFPEQKTRLKEYYDDLAQQQTMFESQLDLTNRTKSQEYPTYYIP